VKSKENHHPLSVVKPKKTPLPRLAPPSSTSVTISLLLRPRFPGAPMARAGGITNAVNVGIAVQADWENREFISHISLNVRRLFDFLVQFEATTKSKLASLNEKLDLLEHRLELLEVQVGTASANPALFNT
ncbi:hypothetical protein EUGRSUZ_I00598, partial [Eucalyptus grandis]